VRAENLILSLLCAAGVGVALTIAWRGRNLPLVTDRLTVPQSAVAAAQDAVRSVATVLAAGLVAGFLVVGLGGRLVMRILGATSGDRAQGRLTEADEVVGEITFGGSLGFVLFVGLLVPAGASLLYLAFRRFLPGPAWIGGLIFGLLLLATFGIDDPLSSDNVDFKILAPLPLAVTLVVVTALLFGVTFAALAARLDHRVGLIADPGWKKKKIAYFSLIALVFPLFLMVAIVYVAVRVIARGRIGEMLKQRPIQLAGQALVLLAATAAAIAVLRTTTEIL
jgi:hypothetical protein